MASPNKLCSACHGALQSSLEDVATKSLSKDCAHHANFADFRDAVTRECFICVKLWDSISEQSLVAWSKDPASWNPFGCWLERRPWAPERYGALYWHIRYLVFNTGLAELKYQGNVFCLYPLKDGPPSSPEDDLSDFESSTSSARVHEQAYHWYKTCRESHETCRRLGSQQNFAPSRLIDVGADGDDSWRLCLYPQDIADPPDYFTLSYRWSQNPPAVLLHSTLDTFRRGAPIDSLPKTFRDVITIARHFSVRYLWIDSLCIIQDSPEDWARESVRMHEVYANSSCNIAASASENPDGGLFRSRTANEALLGQVNIELPSESAKRFAIWDQFFMARLTQGPLAGRGWVFQERVLSSRVLHFCQSQIVWECFEMNRCEIFPNWSPYTTEVGVSRELKTVYPFFESNSEPYLAKKEDKTMSVDVYHQWSHLVKEYSRCALTYPDDRLIAMSGIAEMYKKYTGDEYLAGLWKSRLVEGLNWVVLAPVPRPQNHLRAPSWSWAAVNSAVLPQRTNLPRDDDLIEVLNARVERPGSPSGWKQINGSIELRGCLSKPTVSEVSPRSSQGENLVVQLVEPPSKLFAYPDTTDATFEAGSKLYLLPLRTTLRRTTGQEGTEAESTFGTAIIILEGIIMEPVPEVENSYRRIGHFVVDSLDHAGFFGLLAIPPYPNGDPTKVIADDMKTSVITLV